MFSPRGFCSADLAGQARPRSERPLPTSLIDACPPGPTSSLSHAVSLCGTLATSPRHRLRTLHTCKIPLLDEALHPALDVSPTGSHQKSVIHRGY